MTEVPPWHWKQQRSAEAAPQQMATSKGPRLLSWWSPEHIHKQSHRILLLTSQYLITILVGCFFTFEEKVLGSTLSWGVGAHFPGGSWMSVLRLEDTAWIFKNSLFQKSTWVKCEQTILHFSFLNQRCPTCKWDADEFWLVKGILSTG